MATSPIVLILGAGANNGLQSAAAFAKAGYKVAISARKLSNETDASGYLNIKGDFADPTSIPGIFGKVKSSFSAPPSVVIYNAGAWTSGPADNPLSISVEDFNKDYAVNTGSVFAAAKEAVNGWKELGSKGGNKTFFYTGNMLNLGAVDGFLGFLTLGVGKSATAHLIQNASLAYKKDGYRYVLPSFGLIRFFGGSLRAKSSYNRFYYIDERKPDGNPPGSAIDGAAHAKEFLKLSTDKEQGPWMYTFVKGTGYADFAASK